MNSGTDPAADDSSAPAETTPSPALPRGWRAVGKGADTVRTAGDEDDSSAVVFAGDRDDDSLLATDEQADNATLSNAGLLAIGVFAGVYLLYTIAWFAAAARISPVAPLLVGGDIHFEILRWLAIAAPFVWFAVTFVLTLHTKPWKRFAWLIAGALLLAPWPMFADLTSGGTL